MTNKKTLVVGASEHTYRYSNRAVRQLKAHQHDVVALGRAAGNIDGVPIETDRQQFGGIDTVSLYINAGIQKSYYDYLLSLHPRRIIFNPGTENQEFKQLAESKGIEVLEACTLVMLSIDRY